MVDILKDERLFILVRHSISAVDHTLPTEQWGLSEEGRASCVQFAAQLAPYTPSIAIASVIPRARETAQEIAHMLSIPYVCAEGLHEHERHDVPFLGREAFLTAMRDFFLQPDMLVFGDETAYQAYSRFNGAVMSVLREYRTGNLMVVTHGTVMSLFVAHRLRIDAFSFWNSLQMPAALVFALPSYRLITCLGADLPAPSEKP